MFDIKFEELKKASHISPFKFFLDACSGFKWVFFFENFYALFLSLAKLLSVFLFAKLIGYFSSISIDEFSWKTAMIYVCGIIGTFILQHLLRFIRETTNVQARQMVGWRAEDYALNYVSKHSLKYLKEQKAGQLSQRIRALGYNMWGGFLSFQRISSCSWQIILPLVFIGMQNISFMLIVLIFGILSGGFSFIISKKSANLNKRTEEKNSKYAGEVADALSNILLIKLFGEEKSEINKIERDLRVINAFEVKKSQLINIIHSVQQTFLVIFRISVVVIALHMCYNNKLTVETVVTILLLLDDIIPVFSRFMVDVTLFRNNLGKLADSLKILRVPHDIVEKSNAKNLVVKKGKIEFKNISFGYVSNKNIFRDFNLVINEGEKVGIVGKSGGGKSTLINLLQRNYDIQKGTILIDGTDISKIKIGSLKRNISVISQDNVLFHRPIFKNIAYGKQSASLKQIITASIEALADRFILETPHGYYTITGERGVKLSGGQRQRIAIARAILKNAPILILDEATSALDNETENDIINSLNNLMKNKTVIAIAHRLSTLKNMDKIIVIDRGKIVEVGTPSELLDKKGTFAKLWKLQE